MMIKMASKTLGAEVFFASEGIPFRRNVPLSTQSMWKIGGPVDFLVEPCLETQIGRLLAFCSSNEIPYVVIGRGSNLLFDDAGLRGVVIKIDKNFSAVSVKDDVIIAQSGVFVPKLARLACSCGLSGLEHTVGIPGNLGGLITMNGGSLRQNLGNCVKRVWGITDRGESRVFSSDICSFGYRQSIFQSLNVVITKAELKLTKARGEVIRRVMVEVLRSRRDKFPRREPNCGSVFQSNPALYEAVGPPGRVIEQAGLKGLRVGNAEVSRKHANFIVNKGGASASDVLELIRKVRETIYERTQFSLRCEVKLVKSTGEIMSADATCI